VASRPAAYTVRPGDSLSAISARLFGSAARWPYLYDANLGVVGDNPNMIHAGQVLAARLGARPAYGRATVAAAYRPQHAVTSGDGDGLAPGGGYCAPDCWGDGDGDGFDLNHSPWSSGGGTSYRTGRAAGSPARTSYATGSYGGSYSGSGGMQSCIIARESGGNSQVMNSSGHWGLYQFSAGTWAANGGNPGDFGHASVAEQNQVFYNTVRSSGYSAWTPYDGCL
jgi:hypothetical protein